MSHDHVCVEDRIAKLEEAVANVEKLIADIGLSKEGVHFKCDGKTIRISAHSGGIWVEGKDRSLAAMYSVPHEGAVVSVRGKPNAHGNYRMAADAAIACSPVDGGQVFLVTPDNEAHWITAKEAGKGFQLKR